MAKKLYINSKLADINGKTKGTFNGSQWDNTAEPQSETWILKETATVSPSDFPIIGNGTATVPYSSKICDSKFTYYQEGSSGYFDVTFYLGDWMSVSMSSVVIGYHSPYPNSNFSNVNIDWNSNFKNNGRRITFSEPQTGTMLTWLQTNADKQ